ncbi:MAG: hypothetical protein ACJ72W_18140, partial [Actinoallomurus sp.]
MRSLLALSMVMAESDDQDHILHLAVTSIPSLGRCRFHGAYLNGTGWQRVGGAPEEADAHDDLEAQFAVLSAAGGPVAVLGEPWAWAYPLRSLNDHLGYLVVGAAAEPPSGEQFLLRVLAQQTGIAITNARRRTRQRANAGRLRVANAALAQTVAALRYSTLRLAHLDGLAEAEERLSRDLVEELLAGVDEKIVLARAEALGYDLQRSHRAVAVTGAPSAVDAEELFRAVRDAAQDVGVGSLLAVPFGTLVGIFLSEYGRNRVGDAVRFVSDVLTGLPS